MSELTEYFVRHYTLVMDNDQTLYRSATARGVRAVRDADLTRAQWEALSVADREEMFAQTIGSDILETLGSLCDEALIDRDHPGALLMREVMIFSSYDIEYAIGCHYLPEDADIVDLLADDDDDADVTA